MNSAGLVISATARAPLLPRGLSRLPCLFPQPPSLSRQKASAVFSDRSLIFFLFPTPPPRPSAPIRVLDDAPPDHSALYPFTSRLTLPPPAPQMSFSLLPRLVFSIILMGRLLVPFCLRRRLATSPRDSILLSLLDLLFGSARLSSAPRLMIIAGAATRLRMRPARNCDREADTSAFSAPDYLPPAIKVFCRRACRQISPRILLYSDLRRRRHLRRVPSSAPTLSFTAIMVIKYTALSVCYPIIDHATQLSIRVITIYVSASYLLKRSRAPNDTFLFAR
jgi:hypothetical protein